MPTARRIGASRRWRRVRASASGGVGNGAARATSRSPLARAFLTRDTDTTDPETGRNATNVAGEGATPSGGASRCSYADVQRRTWSPNSGSRVQLLVGVPVQRLPGRRAAHNRAVDGSTPSAATMRGSRRRTIVGASEGHRPSPTLLGSPSRSRDGYLVESWFESINPAQFESRVLCGRSSTVERSRSSPTLPGDGPTEERYRS